MVLKLGSKVSVTTAGETLVADQLVPGQRYVVVINGDIGGGVASLLSYDGYDWTEEPDATDIDAPWRKEWVCTGTLLKIDIVGGSAIDLRVFVHRITGQ